MMSRELKVETDKISPRLNQLFWTCFQLERQYTTLIIISRKLLTLQSDILAKVNSVPSDLQIFVENIPRPNINEAVSCGFDEELSKLNYIQVELCWHRHRISEGSYVH